MGKKENDNKKILKKMDAEKSRADRKKEKEANKKSPKEHISNFLGKVKEYCIKDTSRMILLVAILIAIYIALNLWIRTINLAQIDFTADKLHTLTDQSKNIAKTVDKEMTFYVWKYNEDSTVVDLLKQYQTENDKIKYKIVTSDDLENIDKFGFEEDYPGIIGQSEDNKLAYINDSDLYTYDESFNVVDLTEQKLTNAINNLRTSENTKVYFLEGKTNYTVESGMYYLNYYLENEYYDVGTIDMISDPTIPDDCDVLAIMGLSSDLSVTEADNICAYIEKGGDLIITNDIDTVNKERNYPNFQRVLDEYAISMPNKVVQEGSSNTVSGYSNIVIQAEVASDHEITRLMYNYDTQGYATKPILLGSGVIELDTEKMATNNITATPILMSSTSAKLSDLATNTYDENEDSYYVLGAAIQKTVESGDESRLVVFASTSSFSDNSLDGQTPMISYNANVALNSFAFVANKGELYSIRKTSSYTKYEPTEQQDKVVRMIICALPVLIVLIGTLVWFKRRNLK